MVPPGAQQDVSSPPSDRVGEDEIPEGADILVTAGIDQSVSRR